MPVADCVGDRRGRDSQFAGCHKAGLCWTLRRHRGSCAPDWRPGRWHMAAWPAPPWNYCSPRQIEQKPLNCAGRVVMEYGMRRQAAESKILLVMAMDHLDPPVRTNHSEFVIEIAYGVAAGGERGLGTHLDEWRDDGR